MLLQIEFCQEGLSFLPYLPPPLPRLSQGLSQAIKACQNVLSNFASNVISSSYSPPCTDYRQLGCLSAALQRGAVLDCDRARLDAKSQQACGSGAQIHQAGRVVSNVLAPPHFTWKTSINFRLALALSLVPPAARSTRILMPSLPLLWVYRIWP